MPLTDEQETLEHEHRIALMRADTALKLEQTRWEPWKVMAAAVGSAAAIFTVLGAGIGFLLARIAY